MASGIRQKTNLLTLSKFFVLVAFLLTLAAPGWAAVEVSSYADLKVKFPPVDNVINITEDVKLTARLDIDESVTLRGNGHTLDRGLTSEITGKGSVIRVSGNITVNIDGLTITGSNGGGVNNTGGGMCVQGATVNVTNCTFTGNKASGGSAISVVQGGSANVINCTFTGNTSTTEKYMEKYMGGAIFVMGDAINEATANVINCTFVNNEANNGTEVCLVSVYTFTAVNSIFWNSSSTSAIAGGNNTTLYNCAYRSGSVDIGGSKPDDSNKTITDWPGGRMVTKDTDGVTHTVFKLTSADMDTLINKGLTAAEVVEKLGLTDEAATLVTNALARDQLGHLRDGKPDIGAVEFIPVSSVSLNTNELEFTIGGTMTGTLTATVSPDNASDKTVTWKSSDEKVATVNASGDVTGVGAGTATITVTATNGTDNDTTDDKTDTCTVTVKGTPKVTKTPEEKTGLIYKGTAQELISKGETDHGTLVYKLDTTNYSTDIPTGKNAGEYTVYYKVVGGANYVDVTPENNSLKVTIGRASATVTAEDKSKTSGDADPALTATVTGLVNGESANLINYTLSRAAGEAVGTYAITPTGNEEQGNYTVTFVPGTLTIATKPDPVTPDPVKPDDELTEEQKAAQAEAQKKQEQETEQKAAEAKEAAKTVDTTTKGGQALADQLNGTAEGSTKETQAAALEVKQDLEKSSLDVSDLTANEVEAAVENKKQERQDAVYEASGEVKDPTVPAATDLLAKSDNTALKEANEKLSVQPKVVQPEVLSDDAANQAKGNIAKAASGEQKVAEGVNFDAVKAANRDGLNTSADITIDPADKALSKQTEAVGKVFNAVSADLAGGNEGKGAVIATVLPKMTPKVSGFFPLKVNLRHLLPDPRRRLCFWPSAAHFRRQASGRVAVAGVELAAGQDGDFFFLDENGVPTAVVSGDASKMTAVAFLTAGTPYEDAFITVDATEADQTALDVLAEKATGSDSPTSNKGSGGCDAGLGGVALLALLGLTLRRRK